VIVGPVSKTINNALQGNVSINGGAQMNLSIIPGGDAYDTSGHGVTPTLTALGTSPGAIYILMLATYTAQNPVKATTTPAANTTTTTTTGGVHPVKKRLPVTGMRGMGTMVFASPRNYVPRGSSYR